MLEIFFLIMVGCLLAGAAMIYVRLESVSKRLEIAEQLIRGQKETSVADVEDIARKSDGWRGDVL